MRGISSTFVTRWANFVIGFANTTWSWKPCKQFVSASRNGGDEVTTKIGLLSANAVAMPGIALQNLDTDQHICESISRSIH
jgi:hypothetical protein